MGKSRVSPVWLTLERSSEPEVRNICRKKTTNDNRPCEKSDQKAIPLSDKRELPLLKKEKSGCGDF
jgi:hypothetical protein